MTAFILFYTLRNPVLDFPDDLPADLLPWDDEKKNYLAFTKEGAKVATDYKLTYNNVMLQEEERKKKSLDIRQPDMEKGKLVLGLSSGLKINEAKSVYVKLGQIVTIHFYVFY